VDVQEKTNLFIAFSGMRRDHRDAETLFPELVTVFSDDFPATNNGVGIQPTHETTNNLGVINLARFTQAVELDLQSRVGWTPEDALAHGRFP